MGRAIGLTAAVLVMLAACGDSGSSGEAAADNTAPAEINATETLTVRVTAEKGGGLGCIRASEMSGLDVGNDSRLTVEDGDGAVVGTGTFAPSPGESACDWTATVPDVPVDAGFYRLDAGGEVATVSASEMDDRDWSLEVHIGLTGRVTVEG